jgi:hypothetical protein
MTHPISKHNQPKQKVEKATPENPRNPADSHDQGADAKSNRKGAGATQNDPNGDVDVVEQLKIAWNFVKNPINTNAVMAIATCVGVTIAALGLIGLVINASLTFGLLKTTREANALAYRPYIGVGGVGVVYQWKDSTGKIAYFSP